MALSTREHFWFGLASGFRWCCVLYFCVIWSPFCAHFKPYTKLWLWLRGQGEQKYIACPLCRLLPSRIVQVRKCSLQEALNGR
jgi:hypothetical protein